MTPWWLITLGGLLGSTHCVGMCGAFAALVGLNTGTLSANVRAQLIYSIGRVLSYALLGAMAGFAGKRMVDSIPMLINVPAILCLVSGIILLREGLLSAGFWTKSITGKSMAGCLFRPLFTTFLKTPGLRNALIAGILTGFMPCGLVYAFVSLAASSGDFLLGIETMMAFGVGTVPLLVLSGCGVSFLPASTQQSIWRVAAWSVVLTGLLTIGRGVLFLNSADKAASAQCPFCANSSRSTAESCEGNE
jgi:sulfite exporter TauE/SafE